MNMTTNKVPTDGKSLDQRRARKREIESDQLHEATNQCKATIHRATVGDQLPPMYAKGSHRYACAFRGKSITQDELQTMRETMRKPEVGTDANA